MNKPTSAREYRRILAERRAKSGQTEDVELPSGLVFTLRRPDLNAYIVTGRYPQSIVTEGLKALKEKGIAPNDPNAMQAVLASLNSEGVTDALIFMRELVREACIHPRLVVGARGDDELEPGELDIADFNFIVGWCVDYKGAKNVDGIRSFREGSERGTVGDQHDGQAVQQDAVGNTAD